MIGFLLFVFAASIPLTDLSRYYLGSGSIAELLLVALLLVWSLTFVNSRFRVSMGLALLFFVLVLAVWSWTIAVLREPELLAPPLALVRQVEYFAVAFVVTQLASDAQRRLALVWGLVAGCCIALLITAIHWLAGPDVEVFYGWGPPWAADYTKDTFRVWGPFGNPLPLGSYLATFLGIFFVFTMRESRHKWQGIWSGFLAATALVLVMTGSRSALIVMVVPLVYGLRFVSLRGIMRTAAIGVFLLVPIAFTDIAGVAFGRLTELSGDDFSVVQRLMVYRSALNMMADYPLLGVGADNFAIAYYPAYMERGASLDPTTFTPENMLLLFGAEQGIVAMTLFALALLVALRRGFLQKASFPDTDSLLGEAIAVGILCFVTMSFIQASSDAPSRLLLYTLLGFLFSLPSDAKEGQPHISRPDEAHVPLITTT